MRFDGLRGRFVVVISNRKERVDETLEEGRMLLTAFTVGFRRWLNGTQIHKWDIHGHRQGTLSGGIRTRRDLKEGKGDWAGAEWHGRLVVIR